jgi:tetratricopeptide (TPR) repeat protein
MQFHKAFYEKHGIKITDSAMHNGKSREQIEVEVSFHNSIKNRPINLQTVILLEQAVEKNPASEALKNYLYIAYTKVGHRDKALDCLHRTIKLHPNYAFGIINLANYHILKNELDRASALISEPYDVRRIEKGEFINYSVFLSYYQTVVLLELAKKNQKTAEKYHKLMFEYDSKNKTVKSLSENILDGRLSQARTNMIPADEREVKARPKPILGWEPSDKAPVFVHPEVQQLYEFAADKDMPQALMDTLLALPRETFIQDLENVLADIVRRRKYYFKQKDWDEKTMSFSIHALYFLTELRAYDSLPTILNILRQDEDLLEFWFSDTLHDYFHFVIYVLGNVQLAVLQTFMLESYNFRWARVVVSDVVSQIALRQPDRREEVLKCLKTVMQTHLNQPKNTGIIDSVFLGSIVGDCVNITAIELETEILALYEKGWVDDFMAGNLDEIKASLRKPEDYYGRVNPLPASIQEMYSEKFTDVIENPEKEAKRAAEKGKYEQDPYNDFLTGDILRSFSEDTEDGPYENDRYSYQTQQETVKRVEPKVGRNDPCPCGSGKKYKKCHGS